MSTLLALLTLRPFCVKMAACTDVLKVTMFEGTFIVAAVVPLRLSEEAI